MFAEPIKRIKFIVDSAVCGTLGDAHICEDDDVFTGQPNECGGDIHSSILPMKDNFGKTQRLTFQFLRPRNFAFKWNPPKTSVDCYTISYNQLWLLNAVINCGF